MHYSIWFKTRICKLVWSSELFQIITNKLYADADAALRYANATMRSRYAHANANAWFIQGC